MRLTPRVTRTSTWPASSPGSTYRASMDHESFSAVYFRLGFSYDEILILLAANHGIIVFKWTLNRILHNERLFRRKHTSPLTEVVILNELLRLSGGLHGYRWIHARCVQQGLVVSREDIRVMLTVLDSIGVANCCVRRLCRRQYFAQGPNFIWHLHGYDKLKQYGLCIHGCIDGFSRYMIWLNLYTTNNDPKLIGGYYMTGWYGRTLQSSSRSQNGKWPHCCNAEPHAWWEPL